MLEGYAIGVGTYVEPDGWGIGNKLTLSDWDKAAFRIPTNSGGPIKSLAVNVTISGRGLQRHGGSYGWVRCKIVFVGDGSPDVHHSGWAKVA